jgi:hypothetical protein
LGRFLIQRTRRFRKRKLAFHFVFKFYRHPPTGCRRDIYKFEIKLAGSNCEPVTRCIHFHLTGVWGNEPAQMLAHGFTVTVSSRLM